MPNTSITQSLLASETHFQTRLRSAFLQAATAVVFEDPATVNHTARAAFATTILGSSDELTKAVTQFAPMVVMRPNVINFATTYDFTVPAFVSGTGDADIQSQLYSDWNVFTAAFRA